MTTQLQSAARAETARIYATTITGWGRPDAALLESDLELEIAARRAVAAAVAAAPNADRRAS